MSYFRFLLVSILMIGVCGHAFGLDLNQKISLLSRMLGFSGTAIENKIQFSYTGSACPCPKGILRPAIAFKFDRTKFIPPGTVTAAGKITPLVAGAPLPQHVQFAFKALKANGAVDTSLLLNLNVQLDGTIALQKTQLKAAEFLEQGGSLQIAFKSVESALPSSTLKIVITVLPFQGL